MKYIIHFVTASLASIVTFLWGGADWWLLALVALLVTDYLSGIIAAFINHELSSQKGWRGILKKCLFLLVVAVGHIIDTAVGGGGSLRALVIGFLMANEGLSILENCGRCGLPIPERLLAALEQLRCDTRQDGKNKN